ncbi:MAG: glycosyltransferase family 2 protein [Proteobacteria bacterium]|nr:glycosyltransferase family 2 protein [Pseudomonadota bacterium]MCL2306854.1 glycosyltransferase family 2 protein [Pseudomonadota bacterium]
MKPVAPLVAIVPVYNHAATVGAVVHALHALALPVILIDDGSDAECAAALDALAAEQASTTLLRLPINGGKGTAVIAGLREAHARGYSHALQLDADGQHDAAALPAFLDAMRETPQAVIAGVPHYDASVPKGRLLGRYVTHVWVWINTLSFRIRDSMCGLRIYPLTATLPVLDAMPSQSRMEFDTEILVRLDWAGVPIRHLPVSVRYPLGGVSHFRLWRDNARISGMHARLFFGMLRRLPTLIARHFSSAEIR